MVENISIEAMIIVLYLLRKFVFEVKGIRNSNLLVDKKDFVCYINCIWVLGCYQFILYCKESGFAEALAHAIEG